MIARTRVASKSRKFGFPPVVSSKHVSAKLRKIFQQILLSMAKDSQGNALLDQLNIDGFIKGKPDLFKGIQKMHLYLEGKKHVTS